MEALFYITASIILFLGFKMVWIIVRDTQYESEWQRLNSLIILTPEQAKRKQFLSKFLNK